MPSISAFSTKVQSVVPGFAHVLDVFIRKGYFGVGCARDGKRAIQSGIKIQLRELLCIRQPGLIRQQCNRIFQPVISQVLDGE